MINNPTIIRIRRGVNGFRYSVCDYKGHFIGNINRLSDARKRWNDGIRRGSVVLVRELDQKPDMKELEETIRCLRAILTNMKARNHDGKQTRNFNPASTGITEDQEPRRSSLLGV